MIAEVRTEFPAIYQDVSIEKLLYSYRSAAEKISYLVAGLSRQTLRARPIKDKWSIQEIVFHLLDAELLGLVRMRKLIGEANAILPVYDQERWATSMNYNSRTEDEVLEAVRSFYILRDNNAIMLQALPQTTWFKKAIHPDYGIVTLKNLLELYADHGERHIIQIMGRLEFMNLARNVTVELNERLY